MYQLPVTIRRSYLGLFAIFLVAVIVEGFIGWLGGRIASQPNTEPFVVGLAIFIAVIVLIVALASLYLYWAARLVLTTSLVMIRPVTKDACGVQNSHGASVRKGT
ncbi:MAG: hypothetical protein JWR34_189 [Mycobacterium sp.]|nr:hypothetical protein [Mycobacterium sp.]